MHMPSAPPFTLRALDHVVLRIADLDRSLAFYRDMLGCTVEVEQKQIGLYLVPRDGMRAKLGGAGPHAEGRNVDHFAIRITPFDENAIRAYLAAHDVAI